MDNIEIEPFQKTVCYTKIQIHSVAQLQDTHIHHDSWTWKIELRNARMVKHLYSTLLAMCQKFNNDIMDAQSLLKHKPKEEWQPS